MTPWLLRHLRFIVLLEGASLIALLLIAVPLKRLAGIPEAVSIIGPIHGGLFLWTLGILLLTALKGHLSPLKSLGVGVATLVPFGGLWSHRLLVRQTASESSAA